MRGNPGAGFHYLLRGFSLLKQPSLRLYVAIPLSLNLIIFGFFIGASVELFGEWIDGLLAWLPAWLHFLRRILWPLSLLLLVAATTYLFSSVANIIGAPFNGLLAEKTEALLTGTINVDGGIATALKDAPRSIAKELRKLFYYLPRALAVLAISFFPPLYPITPLLWFALGAWMMALEYCDYPLDNHRYSLAQVRQCISQESLTSLGFGSAVMLGSMVPVLNFLIMPAAVCGATLYWVEKLQPAAVAIDHLQRAQFNR